MDKKSNNSKMASDEQASETDEKDKKASILTVFFLIALCALLFTCGFLAARGAILVKGENAGSGDEELTRVHAYCAACSSIAFIVSLVTGIGLVALLVKGKHNNALVIAINVILLALLFVLGVLAAIASKQLRSWYDDYGAESTDVEDAHRKMAWTAALGFLASLLSLVGFVIYLQRAKVKAALEKAKEAYANATTPPPAPAPGSAAAPGAPPPAPAPESAAAPIMTPSYPIFPPMPVPYVF